MPDIFQSFLIEKNYCDFNQSHVVPSLYCTGDSRIGRFIIEGEDSLNEAILKYAEKSGSFDFLSNPEEDIYTWDDGEKLC